MKFFSHKFSLEKFCLVLYVVSGCQANNIMNQPQTLFWLCPTGFVHHLSLSVFYVYRKAAVPFTPTQRGLSLSLMNCAPHFPPVRWGLRHFELKRSHPAPFHKFTPFLLIPLWLKAKHSSRKGKRSPHKKLSAGDKSLLTLCYWKLALWLPECVCRWLCCNKRMNNGLIFPGWRCLSHASCICSSWAAASHENLKFSYNTIYNMSAAVHRKDIAPNPWHL